MLRRMLQAACRYCESNKGRLHHSTAEKVSMYFKYVSIEMRNSEEKNDFQLLSSSLRADFVLSRCARALNEIQFLSDVTFDQVRIL